MIVNFTDKYISFSTACIRKLCNSAYIEMYVHPEKKLLFIVSAIHQKKRNEVA